MMKHTWANKRTPKGVKPVREWVECSKCGATPLAVSECKGKP